MSFSYTGFHQHVQDHRACGVKFMLMLKNVVECKKMIVPIMMNKERRQRWNWDEALQARTHQILCYPNQTIIYISWHVIGSLYLKP